MKIFRGANIVHTDSKFLVSYLHVYVAIYWKWRGALTSVSTPIPLHPWYYVYMYVYNTLRSKLMKTVQYRLYSAELVN